MNVMIQRRCCHCGHLFDPHPRAKQKQRYCSNKECQRARKSKWQKHKLATDPDYKANQRACQADWHRRHPGYYREFRKEHPPYCRRNTFLQSLRNAKARVIAKMDEFKPAPLKDPGFFYILPLIAKMDALKPTPFNVSKAFYILPLIAKEDSIAFKDSQC
jgi:hypothetical protein